MAWLETVAWLTLGIAIALVWRWRQWRAYRKAEAALDLQSRTRRDWWKHCRDAAETGDLTVGPGLRDCGRNLPGWREVG